MIPGTECVYSISRSRKAAVVIQAIATHISIVQPQAVATGRKHAAEFAHSTLASNELAERHLFGKQVNQLPEALPGVMENTLTVADEQGIEVKREKLPYALTQPRWFIHHFFAQQAKPPWRIPDHRISHYQQPPLLPVESHFARRFSRHANHSQRPDLAANLQLVVKLRALAARVRRIAGMDCGSSPGSRPHPVGRPYVVTVGKQDVADASLRQFIERLLAQLNRIDGKVPCPVDNQKAVEVIAMRLREARPRENIVRDCPHGTHLPGVTLMRT
jgi:hypothetical protein